MKYVVWVVLLLNSCARSPNGAHSPFGTNAGVLPTKNSLVFYRSAAPKPGVPPALADSRARAWFNSSGRVLHAIEQNPIRRQTDMVYLASLPARRLPVDSAGVAETLPALRFWVTVDNTGDSTRVFASNFEVMNNKRSYLPIEKQSYTARQPWLSMWLNDVDAAVTEMMESLTTLIIQPVNR
jgi:hypothetical protein